MAQFTYFDFELACSNLFPASPLSEEWSLSEFIPFLWGFYQCVGGYHTVHTLHAWSMTLVVSRYASIRSMCSCLRRDEPVNRVEWHEEDLPIDTADHFVEYCISLFESVI